MTEDWAARWRGHFPLCECRAYFFAGAQAPLATEVRQATDDFLELWDERAWRFEPAGWDLLEASADLLGGLLGCDPGRVAPADSTSHAMGLATGMVLARWIREGRRPANVVLQHDSHPASTYPWINAQRLGAPVELRWAVTEDGRNAGDALAAAVDDQTLAVVVTHVSFRTGERVDIPALAGRFADRRFALMVDAAQSAGALDLSAETAVCDFIGMPAYKWLLGPPGVGFLVAGADWLDDVGPPFVGWASAREYSVMDSGHMELRTGGGSLRAGMPNFLGLAGAVAGLRLYAQAGPQPVEERIRELTDRLMTGLEMLGYGSPTPRDWASRAGVVLVDLPDAAATMSRLMDAGIEVGVEEGRLRVDPHAYNTEAEIDLLIEHLSAEPGAKS